MTDLEQLRVLPPEMAAQQADYRLREIEVAMKMNFTEIGEICIIADRRELWRQVSRPDGTGYTSFSDWLGECMPCSNATAWAAKEVALKLGGIPVYERRDMPRNTLQLMAKLSPQVFNDERVKSKAISLKSGEFEHFIEKEFPNQHIESRIIMRFHPERTAKERIDIAIETAMELNGISTREEALLCICEEYLQDVGVVNATQTFAG